MSRRDVLRDPRFYLLLPIGLAAPCLITGIFFHQNHLVEVRGWSMSGFAATFVAFAGTQPPASLLAGHLIDRRGALPFLPFFMVPFGAALLVLAFVNEAWGAPAFMALAGLSAGASSPLLGAAWAELYGTRHLGAIRALYSSIMVFSTSLSPFLFGLLIDGGVSIAWIYAWCAVFLAVACLLAIPPALSGSGRSGARDSRG